MGGRGGGSSRPAASSAAAADPSPADEFRRWLGNPRDISSSAFEASDGKEKIRIGLPDREAIVSREGKFVIARDDTTDQQLFSAASPEGIFRQVALAYGAPVVHTDQRLRKKSYGTRAADLKATPMAKKYGVN